MRDLAAQMGLLKGGKKYKPTVKAEPPQNYSMDTPTTLSQNLKRIGRPSFVECFIKMLERQEYVSKLESQDKIQGDYGMTSKRIRVPGPRGTMFFRKNGGIAITPYEFDKLYERVLSEEGQFLLTLGNDRNTGLPIHIPFLNGNHKGRWIWYYKLSEKRLPNVFDIFKMKHCKTGQREVSRVYLIEGVEYDCRVFDSLQEAMQSIDETEVNMD